jgi:hypothetical protein
MAPTFLGLDLSTQQIKAVLITDNGDVVHESAVAFDADLSHHGTKSGALHGPDGEVTSPGEYFWLIPCMRASDPRRSCNVVGRY